MDFQAGDGDTTPLHFTYARQTKNGEGMAFGCSLLIDAKLDAVKLHWG